MVKNPGAAARSGAIKPLNAPLPVRVRTDAGGNPTAVCIPAMTSHAHTRTSHGVGPWLPVASVEDIWKINDEWWRGEESRIERIYFELLLESGRRVTVFHDVTRCAWHRQAS